MPDATDDLHESLAGLLDSEGIDPERQRELIAFIDPSDLAEFMEDLRRDDRIRIFELLDPEKAARVIASLPHPLRVELVDQLGEERLVSVVEKMPADVVADIIDHLPAHREKRILDKIEHEHREEIQNLRQHAPTTAGGLMTTNFVAVTDGFTAAETLKAIQGAVDAETIEYIYVTDDFDRLRGVCSIRAILRAAPAAPVRALMHQDVQFVGATMDQEEVARIVKKYDLKAIPVVDDQLKLLGVVTQAHILDVIHQEAGEDIMKMAGSNMVDSLHTPTWTRMRMRMPWLLITLGGELFIALVISQCFKATIEKAAILAAFMPAIAATGGNVGLQSTTIIVRALGMGTIRPGQALKVVWSEFRLGLLLGLCCGVITGLVAYLLQFSSPSAFKLVVSVFVAMVSATTATSIVGAVEPLVLHRLKFDPATACGPFVTMFNDLFGTTVFFTIALMLDFKSA